MADYWPLSFVRFYSMIPWVPETFLGRFPVSVKSVFSRGFAARGSGQHRNFLRTREKPLVPRVIQWLLTSTSSSVRENGKKRTCPISSWPHGWWLTRMYCSYSFVGKIKKYRAGRYILWFSFHLFVNCKLSLLSLTVNFFFCTYCPASNSLASCGQCFCYIICLIKFCRCCYCCCRYKVVSIQVYSVEL